MVSSSTLGRLSTQTMAFSGTAARFGRNFHRQFSPHFIVTTGPWRFARCLCEQTPLCSQFKAALLFAVPADWRGCSSRFNVAVESCVVSRGLVMRGAPLDFSASSPHQTNSARQASSRTSPHGGRTFVLSGLKLSVWIISGLFKGYCPGVALVLGTMCHWQVLREGTHFYLLRLRYFVSSSGFVFLQHCGGCRNLAASRLGVFLLALVWARFRVYSLWRVVQILGLSWMSCVPFDRKRLQI